MSVDIFPLASHIRVWKTWSCLLKFYWIALPSSVRILFGNECVQIRFKTCFNTSFVLCVLMLFNMYVFRVVTNHHQYVHIYFFFGDYGPDDIDCHLKTSSPYHFTEIFFLDALILGEVLHCIINISTTKPNLITMTTHVLFKAIAHDNVVDTLRQLLDPPCFVS